MKCKDFAAAIVHQASCDSSMASLIEVLTDQFLRKQSVKAIAAPATECDMNSAKENKSVTPKTRSLVITRDQHCQFIDPETDRQCECTYSLQTDHKTSRWAGGNHELRNLQALCPGHNRLKYQLESNLKLF